MSKGAGTKATETVETEEAMETGEVRAAMDTKETMVAMKRTPVAKRKMDMVEILVVGEVVEQVVGEVEAEVVAQVVGEVEAEVVAQVMLSPFWIDSTKFADQFDVLH